MQAQLNASASTAGGLMSTHRFAVPEFQREYSWLKDEYVEFWNDLRNSLTDDSYFLGLIILTADQEIMQVVDGQQRLLTITLLAAAIRHEAVRNRRQGLADQIESSFLRVLDYDSDLYDNRITLSEPEDNTTLGHIIASGDEIAISSYAADEDTLSRRMVDAYVYLREQVRIDLKQDPFKRLSLWAQFITDRLYFAVFVHPDASAAYRVFEVINTRGRELTTADLLKNFLLSQTAAANRSTQYARWRALARQFPVAQPNAFVTFIRHVVSLQAGYVLPKDLYDFLSQRRTVTGAPPIAELLEQMEKWLPLYLQMADPTIEGPGSAGQLRVFEAMNELAVVAVRPLLMAISETSAAEASTERVLRIVTRRAVVGNLGTSGAERRFSEEAKYVASQHSVRFGSLDCELTALDAARGDFVDQLSKRSLNKSVLQFIRRSIVQSTVVPEPMGNLQFIRPRTIVSWPGFEEPDAVAYWSSTIGNTFLSGSYRRPHGTSDWDGVRDNLLPTGVEGEWSDELSKYRAWDANAIAAMGEALAKSASDVWY